jgi:hypothetical protein
VLPFETQAEILARLKLYSKKRIKRQLSIVHRSMYSHAIRGKDFIMEIESSPERALSLLLPVALQIRRGKNVIQAIIVSQDRETVQNAIRLYSEAASIAVPRNPLASTRIVDVSVDSYRRFPAGIDLSEPGILIGPAEKIIDHIRRNSIDLKGTKTVVVEIPDGTMPMGFLADLQFIYSKLSSIPFSAVLMDQFDSNVGDIAESLCRPSYIATSVWERDDYETHTPLLSRLLGTGTQERNHMSKRSFEGLDEDLLREKLQEMNRRIVEEEDPAELNYLRRLIRKNVSIFRRGYLMAYMLKNVGEIRAPERRKNNGEYTSIFIGIGKNRRVFPKDLIQLFSDIEGVNADDIGQIKILDNYSFLEITPEKAQSAIDNLNGKDYRGRKLTVNFARKKD